MWRFNLIRSSELAVGELAPVQPSGKAVEDTMLSEITSNYYEHLALRTAPFFLLRFRYWRIPPRRDRDRKLSYMLYVT